MRQWKFTILLLSSTLIPELAVSKDGIIASQIESIGKYSNGCLSPSGEALEDGTGYRVARKSRNRNFAHPKANSFIKRLAKSTFTKGIGTILVGDISQEQGGLMPWGHRSHQNGLDVDILFTIEEKKYKISDAALDTIKPKSMLVEDHSKVSSERFTDNHVELLKTASSDFAVDRIFVHPLLKKKLCTDLKKADWLRKIRPWYGHHNHFHVRIKCPRNSPTCRPTVAIPPGPGCNDHHFSYWFSDLEKLRKISQSEPSPKHSKAPVPDHKKHPRCRK